MNKLDKKINITHKVKDIVKFYKINITGNLLELIKEKNNSQEEIDCIFKDLAILFVMSVNFSPTIEEMYDFNARLDAKLKEEIYKIKVIVEDKDNIESTHLTFKIDSDYKNERVI